MDITSAWLGVAGGALIGGAASGLLLFDGKIAGISGIVAGLLRPRPGDALWRLCFVGGLLCGGALLLVFQPSAFAVTAAQPLSSTGAAGLLVGFGTRFSGGCTSGHGVCGLARRSPRSLAATVTFMVAGMATVFAARHILS